MFGYISVTGMTERNWIWTLYTAAYLLMAICYSGITDSLCLTKKSIKELAKEKSLDLYHIFTDITSALLLSPRSLTTIYFYNNNYPGLIYYNTQHNS